MIEQDETGPVAAASEHHGSSGPGAAPGPDAGSGSDVGSEPDAGSDSGAGSGSDVEPAEERTEAAEAVERELALLFRRARSMAASVAAQVHPRLDAESYVLLLMVADAGRLRGMDVAGRAGLDKSTVSRQIAALVDLDLLERVPDPDDGRARLIQLSAQGRQRLTRVQEQGSERLRAVFASWSTHDLQEFARLLGWLNSAT
ncbi:MarR family winged helix-turn-helix transcriptional regulator [Salinifilum ghardaiensis]